LRLIVAIGAAFENIFLIAVLTIIAVASKIIGCSYASKSMGMSFKDSLVIGVGMVPRGEISLIIGLYGLTLGIIDQPIYSTIVFMSFLTTLIAPMVLKILYSNQNKPHS
jgi:Kef-type K+ transport system membrane component KefB